MAVSQALKRQNEEFDLHVHSIITTMPFSDDRLQEVREETGKDPQMMILKDTILKGWPQGKSDCPPEIVEYWNIRDELSIAEDLIFKGTRIVIPKIMRQNLLHKIHEVIWALRNAETEQESPYIGLI